MAIIRVSTLFSKRGEEEYFFRHSFIYENQMRMPEVEPFFLKTYSYKYKKRT
jgi:hypothetical protein